MSNKLYLSKMPKDLSRAQELACQIYNLCVDRALPRDVSKLILALSNVDPIISLTLSGPEGLAKAGMLSGIYAYMSLGDKLPQAFTKINVTVSLDVLEWVKGIELGKVSALRAAGHSTAMVMVKTVSK